jgi:hypothetical protein
MLRWLRRMRGASEAVTLSCVELPTDGYVAVVGESHRQDALRRTERISQMVGEERTFRAVLVPEPTNPHDRNAVMVFSEHGHLGYLPRDVAAEYRRLFVEIRKSGYQAGACEGILTGGTRDKPFFGVVLRLSDPDECLDSLR